MTTQEFQTEVALFTEHRNAIATAKRPGYTSASSDVLANFRRSAEIAGVTPFQAWAVLAYKHFSALLTFAKDPTIPQAEAIIGRFADAVNYCELAIGLLRDYEAEQRAKEVK